MYNPARFAPMALVAAVGLTFLQTAAFAGTPMQPTHRTVSVQTADLNLANPADVARLDARIANAARTVCTPADWRSLREVADRPACVKAAVAAATERKVQLVARAQTEQLAAAASRPNTAD